MPSGSYSNVVVDQSLAYIIVLVGFGIVFLVGFLIICYHLYRNRPWDQPGPWCCGLCKKTGGRRGHRGSCEKTPAFTVQTLYASQISSFDLEPTQSAAEIAESPSTVIQDLHSRRQVGKGTITRDSLTSFDTVTTSLSETSVQTSQDSTGLGSDVYSEGACSLPKECARILKANVHTQIEIANSVLSTNNSLTSSSESSSISSSSSCTHERCQLCLPKGLSTRPSIVSSPNNNIPGVYEPMLEPERSLPLKQGPPLSFRHLEEQSKTSEFECTQL